jgi:hypothetical protein
VGSLTNAQGIALDALSTEISNRAEFANIKGNLALALKLNNVGRYPAIKYGTQMLEIAPIQPSPDGDDTTLGAWRTVEVSKADGLALTEQEFWDLDEALTMTWYRAIMEANPHRNLAPDAIKKFLRQVAMPTSNNT